MSLDVAGLAQGKKLRDIGVKLPVGNHVSQALEVIRRIVDATLRKPLPLILLVYPEHRLRLRLEEVIEVLAEDQRDARQVTQGRNHAASFQLRQKACREPGLPTKFHQAHRFLQTETFDPFTDVFLCDEGFGTGLVYGTGTFLLAQGRGGEWCFLVRHVRFRLTLCHDDGSSRTPAAHCWK